LAEEGGGVSKLEGHLLKLARKEKKKSTDLEVGDWLYLLLLCKQPLA
jgi:hypothetical protein